MLILGFQKMTLLDYPGKVACTIFTGGCNLRCPFCHNALLVTKMEESEKYSPEKILEFLSTRTKLLDGVCITGGEPLLQPDIQDFIKEIKNMGYKLKLDTNGFYPDKLIKLVQDKLVDYVAVDIKNSFEKYPITTGIKNLDLNPLKKTIDFLLKNNVDFEFRTTVVKEFHTPQDIEKIASEIIGAPRYFLQNFTDSGNLIGENLHSHDQKTLEFMRDIAKKYVSDTQLRGI